MYTAGSSAYSASDCLPKVSIKQPKTYEQQVELNTKIIFKNKIYEMNTIDEVSSRLIRVFS